MKKIIIALFLVISACASSQSAKLMEDSMAKLQQFESIQLAGITLEVQKNTGIQLNIRLHRAEFFDNHQLAFAHFNITQKIEEEEKLVGHIFFVLARGPGGIWLPIYNFSRKENITLNTEEEKM